MIEAYFRPEKLEDAIRIIEQDPTSTVPLGGGNILSRTDAGRIKVVDLQALKLNGIRISDGKLTIGACATLQSLIESPEIPAALKQATLREGTINQRRTGTLAGDLVSSGGNSPLGAVMIALGSFVTVEPGSKVLGIKEWLAPAGGNHPRLASRFEIPDGARAVYADISKTPQDIPIGYSVLATAGDGNYSWISGLIKEATVIDVKGRTKEELIKNAHSHLFIQKNNSTYSKNMIGLFLDRLFDEISSVGAGK